MNKFFVKTTLASLMLISASAVMADAPTAELKVAGKVAVPGCTIAQSAGGTYDYGSISPTLVKASATTALTAQTQTWTVTCDAQTFLSFRVIDTSRHRPLVAALPSSSAWATSTTPARSAITPSSWATQRSTTLRLIPTRQRPAALPSQVLPRQV
jgi:type 1 fimbria pilin